MIDPIEIRNQVRRTLATRPEDETMPEPYLFVALEAFFGKGKITAGDMMQALQWNEGRGWVEKRRNADLERNEWKLTERGRVKEGV